MAYVPIIFLTFGFQFPFDRKSKQHTEFTQYTDLFKNTTIVINNSNSMIS